MIVCIDTNVVLGMFGQTAPWLLLRHGLLANEFSWVLSNEITLEYEEVAAREIGAAYAARIGLFIELVGQTRGNIHLISPDFRFQTIQADLDDNKFADCAICANADYIITLDRHFQQMKGYGYRPQPITPDEFISRHLPKKQES
jgi:putative PIN family toxin of toxin-antitoxin system